MCSLLLILFKVARRATRHVCFSRHARAATQRSKQASLVGARARAGKPWRRRFVVFIARARDLVLVLFSPPPASPGVRPTCARGRKVFETKHRSGTHSLLNVVFFWIIFPMFFFVFFSVCSFFGIIGDFFRVVCVSNLHTLHVCFCLLFKCAACAASMIGSH